MSAGGNNLFQNFLAKISSPADASDEILPGCAGYLLLIKGRDQGHCGNSEVKSWKEEKVDSPSRRRVPGPPKEWRVFSWSQKMASYDQITFHKNRIFFTEKLS